MNKKEKEIARKLKEAVDESIKDGGFIIIFNSKTKKCKFSAGKIDSSELIAILQVKLHNIIHDQTSEKKIPELLDYISD